LLFSGWRGWPADDGFSGKPLGSAVEASPPKAPLQNPKNTRRIVDRPKVASGAWLARILVQNAKEVARLDIGPDDRAKSQRQASSDVANNMKGRALSFENHTYFQTMRVVANLSDVSCVR
jgi:hypothetical protein